MSRADKIALIISFLAVLATAWISFNIFEGIPHLEDEFAYIWQAQVIARGELTVPSPPEHKSFLVPFVVDLDGQRFGKYPLGWPAMLSLGERIGLRWLVNPLLAGLAVWLTYRLGAKTLGKTVGILAAALTATSPFFLMNSGALLAHPWGLVLSTGFAVSWLDAIEERGLVPAWLPTLTAGFSLGMLALSRPFTALGVAIPFGIYSLITLFHGSTSVRKRIISIGAITLMIGSLHFIWQYTVTGDPLINPYTLWWEYDKVGFGPGVGVTQQGHNLKLAWSNLKFTLNAGSSDLFGWFKMSWLFLPFGFWAVRRKPKTLILASITPVLVLLYLGYWIGAWVLGPRYYYEGLFSLTILTAAGIAWLAGWTLKVGDKFQSIQGNKRFRPIAVTTLVLFLIAVNLIFYIPGRIGGMRGLFGSSRQQLEPFQTSGAGVKTPALIIVDTREWRAYAGLLELSNPMLDSPFIFIWSRGPKSNASVVDAFPERSVYYYRPEEPWVFYSTEP
jgi:4-amino-4-deoxy-L-arabinose transferase-like glycosyltransferase